MRLSNVDKAFFLSENRSTSVWLDPGTRVKRAEKRGTDATDGDNVTVRSFQSVTTLNLLSARQSKSTHWTHESAVRKNTV